jgi:hypothetical protein
MHLVISIRKCVRVMCFEIITYKYVSLDMLAGMRAEVVSKTYYWTEFNFFMFFLNC